jgi:hypothetical protein
MSNRCARGAAGGCFVHNLLIRLKKLYSNRGIGIWEKTGESVYFASHWEGGYTGGAFKKFFTGKREGSIKE